MRRIDDMTKFTLLLFLVSLVDVWGGDAKVVAPKAATNVVATSAQVAAKTKEAIGNKVGRWDAHESGFYSDDFARRKIFPLAAAAYSDDPTGCLTRSFENASVALYIRTECEFDTQKEFCSGYTALSHSDKAIAVAFRGTSGFMELVAEVNHSVLKYKIPSPIGGLVSEYFHSVFQRLWDLGIGHSVNRLIDKHPDYEIWVTGHSLGGAVASIVATYIWETNKLQNERIKLVTFGQPQTGDSDYATGHNLRLPRSYRVTHRRDLVAHVPPKYFEHYWHHKSEVWYPQGMRPGDSFVVCNADEDPKNCSDSHWLNISIEDHLRYFEKQVSVYEIGGCVDDASL